MTFNIQDDFFADHKKFMNDVLADRKDFIGVVLADRSLNILKIVEGLTDSTVRTGQSILFSLPPNADHVVGGDGHNVEIVVAGRDLIDDDVVSV